MRADLLRLAVVQDIWLLDYHLVPFVIKKFLPLFFKVKFFIISDREAIL
jgi:hypothetical protein